MTVTYHFMKLFQGNYRKSSLKVWVKKMWKF